MSIDLVPIKHYVDEDIIAYDALDDPILIIQVDTRTNASLYAADHVVASMRMTGIALGMSADYELIRFYRSDSPDPREPILRLDTSCMLSSYDPDFDRKRVSQEYFETLIEGWLRDFAFNWKSPHPPGLEYLESMGLATRLAGGITANGRLRALLPRHRD